MNKVITLQRKIKKIFSIYSLICIITSCNFYTYQNQKEKTISVNFIAKLPDDYNNFNDVVLRSAIPAFNDGDLSYKITAIDTENNSVITYSSSKNFKLALFPNKTYTITVDAYDASYTSITDIPVLFTGTTNLEPIPYYYDGTTPPFEINLALYKNTEGEITDGTGSLELKFKIADDVSLSNIKYSFTLSGNGTNTVSNPNLLENNQVVTIGPINSIPSNKTPYNLNLKIYNTSTKLYELNTDVMIFANAKTNTWKNEEGICTSGEDAGVLVITQAMVNQYISKYFYVKVEEGATLTAESGQGTFESPWNYLDTAINHIKEINDGQNKYTIYILSDLNGSFTSGETTLYPGRFVLTLDDDYEKDLKICVQGIGENITLNSEEEDQPEVNISNNSSNNVYCEFVNLNCTNGINIQNLQSINNGNAGIKLSSITSNEISIINSNSVLNNISNNDNISITNSTSTLINVIDYNDIDVTNSGITLIGVQAQNITLDQCSTISLNGYAEHSNTITELYLPNDSEGNQIKINILDEAPEPISGTELTLTGSRIGITTDSIPVYGINTVTFTEGFSTNANTSEAAYTIFESKADEPFAICSLENEVVLAISSGSLSAQNIPNITFEVDKNEIESCFVDIDDENLPEEIESTIRNNNYITHPRTITVTAKDSNENPIQFDSLSLDLCSSGESIASETYNYEDENYTIKVPYGIVEEDFVLWINGIYNSIGYSAHYPITIVNNFNIQCDKYQLFIDDSEIPFDSLTVNATHSDSPIAISSFYGVNNLDTSTSSSTITLNENSELGNQTINCYIESENYYACKSITISVAKLLADFKINGSFISDEDVTLSSSDTGNARQITVNARLQIETTDLPDYYIDNYTQKINDYATVYLTDSENHQIYIFDDITQNTNGITYKVPTNLATGTYTLYCEINYMNKFKQFSKTLIIE